jgi:hypothetical protein
MMVHFPKKEVAIENYDNLQMFVNKFIAHTLTAPRKWGIPKLHDNYVRVIPSPWDCNQGVV